MITFILRMLCIHDYHDAGMCRRTIDGFNAGANVYYICTKCGKVRKIKMRQWGGMAMNHTICGTWRTTGSYQWWWRPHVFLVRIGEDNAITIPSAAQLLLYPFLAIVSIFSQARRWALWHYYDRMYKRVVRLDREYLVREQLKRFIDMYCGKLPEGFFKDKP